MDAVIFDLDGTLWDATGCACAVWNRVLERHREVPFRVTGQQVAQLMGKTMEEIGTALLGDADAALRGRVVREFEAEEVAYLYENGAVLYDGVEAVLKTLRQTCALYIVSNCQDGYVSAYLHAHKLGGYFRDAAVSGRAGVDKAENLRRMIARHQLKNPVYIGDTAGDEKAARAVGIPFVWASYGFGRAAAPDGVIASMEELPEALRRLSEKRSACFQK